MNHMVNYGFQLIMTYQYWLIGCNKSPSQDMVLTTQEARGGECLWKLPILLLSYSINLKVHKNIKSVHFLEDTS